MSHVRTEIRNRIVQVLQPVGTVYASRIVPIAEASLPVILVYTNTEEIELDSLTDLQRRLTVVIEVVAEATTNLDTVLDGILASIEAALEADPTLNGLAMESIPASIEVTMSNEGAKPIGRAKLGLTVLYHTGAIVGGWAPLTSGGEITGTLTHGTSVYLDFATHPYFYLASDSPVTSNLWDLYGSVDSAQGPMFGLAKSRGTKAASTSVQADDSLGAVDWYGYKTGVAYVWAARMHAVVQSMGAVAPMAKLSFLTNDGTVAAPTERGYVDGDGGLVIGSPTGASKGAGTVNATNLYKNGSAVLTDAPSDGQKYVRKDGAWVIA